jgi:hypothetical protein
MVALLAVIGAGAIVAGLALVSPPLALVVVGAFILLAARGYAIAGKGSAGE